MQRCVFSCSASRYPQHRVLRTARKRRECARHSHSREHVRLVSLMGEKRSTPQPLYQYDRHFNESQRPTNLRLYSKDALHSRRGQARSGTHIIPAHQGNSSPIPQHLSLFSLHAPCQNKATTQVLTQNSSTVIGKTRIGRSPSRMPIFVGVKVANPSW